MTDTPVVDLRIYPVLRMLQEAETMCSMPASEDSEVDALSCKASEGDGSMTDTPAVDVCCDSLQPEAFAIDAAPSFHVQCTYCKGPYKYQRNNKLYPVFFICSPMPTAVLSGSMHGRISALNAAGTITVAAFACLIVDL